MRIVSFTKAANIAELANQVYGIKPGDPQAAAAQKALLAANPGLSGNLATLATGAPIVAPALTETASSAVNDPIAANLQKMLQGLVQAATAASQAQTTGSTDATTAAPDAAHAPGLSLLSDDVKSFLTLHFS